MLKGTVGTIERRSTSLITIVNRSETKSGKKSDGFFSRERRKNGDVVLVKQPVSLRDAKYE